MRRKLLWLSALLLCLGPNCITARTDEIHPATAAEDEEFERVANALKPGDELILHGGIYSQTGRRAVTARGTPEQSIVLRTVTGQAPLLTRPADDRDRHNNMVFDCSATGITAAPHAAVPQVRNATIVHNAIFNAPVGVRLGWSKATNMVFANNAVFCATGTAIRADALGTALLRDNAVHGRLAGVAMDDRQFFDGGTPALAFLDATRHDFWPRPGSPRLRRADAAFGPPLDFNSTKRSAHFDAGAYEAEGQPQNPGWTIQAGLKR